MRVCAAQKNLALHKVQCNNFSNGCGIRHSTPVSSTLLLWCGFSATPIGLRFLFLGFQIHFDKPGILRLECAAFRNAEAAKCGPPIAPTQQRNTDENLFRQATRGQA
jgi:hypothetical protein